MHHYQIVLGQMRAGLSDRQIAKLKLMGRAKCMQFRAVAQAQEWFAGALPDAATLAGIFLTRWLRRHRCARVLRLTGSACVPGWMTMSVLRVYFRRLSVRVLAAVILRFGALYRSYRR